MIPFKNPPNSYHLLLGTDYYTLHKASAMMMHAHRHGPPSLLLSKTKIKKV